MTLSEAQREIRTRSVGGAYGQFVSGAVWLLSAALATGRGPRAAILMLVVGGIRLSDAGPGLPTRARRAASRHRPAAAPAAFGA